MTGRYGRTMSDRGVRALLVLALVPSCATSDSSSEDAAATRPPNILLVYTDDVGYGDVGCYEGSRTPTPNIDRLATEGIRFTDAHCSAATCTPSRFALLTGEYAFRRKGTGIASGDAGLIIDRGKTPAIGILPSRSLPDRHPRSHMVPNGQSII